MLENAKITPKQLILLIVISRLVITITFFPALEGPPGNQDEWLSVLLSIPAHLLLSAPIYLLWKRFPNQSFIEYSQTILGKVGKLIGLLYVLYFFHALSVFLFQWSAFLTTAVMPETPVLFFLVFLLPFCAYAVLKGVEVISRLAEFLAPFVFMGLIIIFLLLTKDMDLKVFTPFMEKSFMSILVGAFILGSRTSEILVLAMLLPYLKTKKGKVKSVFIFSYSIMAFFWIICTITVLATLGLDLTRILQFAYLNAVRLVNVGDFIERIESIHLSIWILSGYLRISLYFYVIVMGLSQVVGLKSYKPLVLSALTILLPISLSLQSNIAELNEFLSYKIAPWFNLFFIFFIPSILLSIAVIRKQGEN
ncbi:MAG: endospore germination permease [Desulfosporosinus sp.]|nr:endospore germination permease [Desulfosporosinus sp.]